MGTKVWCGIRVTMATRTRHYGAESMAESRQKSRSHLYTQTANQLIITALLYFQVYLRKGMPYHTFSRKGMPKLFCHKKGCQWSSFSRKGMPKGPLASDWPVISQVVRIINATSHPTTEQPMIRHQGRLAYSAIPLRLYVVWLVLK